MDPKQQPFDTFGSWLVTRLLADMASAPDTGPTPLYRCINALYSDMLANPASYGIPTEAFVQFIARVFNTPEEESQHEALKAARMRVRKVVLAYIQFLFHLGQSLEHVEETFFLARAEFEKLASAGSKQSKAKLFPKALERCGLTFSTGEPVHVSNLHYPGMVRELAAFSQACAKVKEFDFYLFRRCDFSVYDGKTGPNFSDAVRIAPADYQKEIIETDECLRRLRYRREIFIDEGDMNYRVRYTKKGELGVYWVRIQETFEPDLLHYLRWNLESNQTNRLFDLLDRTQPGLSHRVFEGLKPCGHCYGDNCMDRKRVEWGGAVKEACQGSGWNDIGYEHEDYERLRVVLETLSKV